MVILIEQRIEELEAMDWLEFVGMSELQVDESMNGEGLALFYNDGIIQVSVDIHSEKVVGDVVVEDVHDEKTLWYDKELLDNLRELAIDTLKLKL